MAKHLTSGIDFRDVKTLMEGLEGIHELRVELTVSVSGSGSSGVLDITALAWVPSVEAHQVRPVAEVKSSWPDKVHPTFDNAVYGLLYDLDRAIGRAYAQEEIPKA